MVNNFNLFSLIRKSKKINFFGDIDTLTKSLDKKIFSTFNPFLVNSLFYSLLGLFEILMVKKQVGDKILTELVMSNQIFGIFYSFLSFIPLLIVPKISDLYSSGKINELLNLVFTSIIFSLFLGSILILIFNLFPNLIFNFFISNSKNNNYVNKISIIDYLSKRSFLYPLFLINSLIFSILKGMNNYKSSLSINMICDFFFKISNPYFIKFIGINGANLLDLTIELFKLCFYFKFLICNIGNENLVLWKNYLSSLNPLIVFKMFVKDVDFFIRNGFFIQSKNLIRKTLYIRINKKILSFENGNLSDHIILCKIYDIGFTFYKCMNFSLAILLPSIKFDENITENPKEILFMRFIFWGIVIGSFQLFSFYFFKVHLLNTLIKNFNLTLLNGLSNMNNFDFLITLFSCISNGIFSYKETFYQVNNQNFLNSVLSIFFSILSFAIIENNFKLNFPNTISDIWLVTLIMGLLKNIIL